MQFETPLEPVVLLRRYKRFLADIRFTDGRETTVHSPNTGSMMGCAEPGMTVWIRDTQSTTRKYPYAWELSQTDGGTLININTLRSNGLAKEAIESGVIETLRGYETIRSEVKYGEQNSRIDLLLRGEGMADCYVEIKNVTARVDEQGEALAMFPDAVSARGTKHLQELMAMVAAGQRAVLLFCVSRDDVSVVRPADEIDPLYGKTLREAAAFGVEILAYACEITPRQTPTTIRLARALPVRL